MNIKMLLHSSEVIFLLLLALKLSVKNDQHFTSTGAINTHGSQHTDDMVCFKS